MHKIDFGMKAEWHFFATSHGKNGKNVCDGFGGWGVGGVGVYKETCSSCWPSEGNL